MRADAMGPVQAMDAAFAGQPIDLVDHDGVTQPMALRRWTGCVDEADRALLLAHCNGRTIDLGCGPGRIVEGLGSIGVPAMGVDISPEAIRQARRRGVLAMVRDVFAPVPGEGRWDVALLADGNIGIGGAPERLLRRVRQIVRPGGRVVVELHPEGTRVVQHRWRLRVGEHLTQGFDWTVVGLDAIEPMAEAAGFTPERLTSFGDRHAAVLRQVA